VPVTERCIQRFMFLDQSFAGHPFRDSLMIRTPPVLAGPARFHRVFHKLGPGSSD
jgi:hypothetical protein